MDMRLLAAFRPAARMEYAPSLFKNSFLAGWHYDLFAE
jgi:hypothetical protein